jgi:uncharacterized RDD family membrane protein YckC
VAENRRATSASRILAYVAIAAGLSLAAAALLADVIGVGGGGGGIGWKQLIAAIAGLVVALAGVAFLMRPDELIRDDR